MSSEPDQFDLDGAVLRRSETELRAFMEALAVRLQQYHQETVPAIEEFRRKEYVITVDSTPPMAQVQQEIRGRLGLPAAKPDLEVPAPGPAGA